MICGFEKSPFAVRLALSIPLVQAKLAYIYFRTSVGHEMQQGKPPDTNLALEEGREVLIRVVTHGRLVRRIK